MSPELLETTFALLRLSLDAESLDSFLNRIKEHPLSKEDWVAIYDFCKKQTIIGVVLVGVNKLPEDLRPPREILDHWICQGFYIHQQNIKMNAMCAKVTKMFADRGLRSVILKGQANARLYPDPFSRQCGDIDILVEGGKKNVIRHLKEMGLMEGATIDLHHVHLKKHFFGDVLVEVHFKPIEYLPLGKGRCLERFLKKKMDFANCISNPSDFFEPTLDYSLVMQLGHIRQHFFDTGIGLRQIVDFYQLLRTANDSILKNFASNVKKMGLEPMLAALLFSLRTIFHASGLFGGENAKWGGIFLKNAVDGGNFGNFSLNYENIPFFRWLNERLWPIKLFSFDSSYAVWCEMVYARNFVYSVPQRLLSRRFFIRQKRNRM